MTMFLDLRTTPSGGFVAHTVSVLSTDAQAPDAATKEFEDQVRGRNIVLATHGFNVNGVKGVTALSEWGHCVG